MGVQLNIKDGETIRLARELAAQAGTSVTETIRVALEAAARKREAESDAQLADMIAFSEEAFRTIPGDVKKMSLKEIMDSIYDENGLPG